MNNREYNTLYRACNLLEDGPDHRSDNYALNIIDVAINFQTNNKAVKAARKHYNDKVRYKSHKKLKDVVDSFPDTKRGNKRLASHLWSNDMWTRTEFLRVLLEEFDQRGIRGQKSLKKWLTNAEFKRDVKGQFKSKHHSMGIALFHWLCLRCGIETIKPDVHVLNFVEKHIGRRPQPEECIEALVTIAQQQRRECCRLDSAIWHLRRDGSDR